MKVASFLCEHFSCIMSSYAESQVCEGMELPPLPVFDLNDDKEYEKIQEYVSQCIKIKNHLQKDLLEKQMDFREMLMEIENRNVCLKTEVWALDARNYEHEKLISSLKHRVCKLDNQIDHLLTKLNNAHVSMTKMQHELGMKDGYIRLRVLEKKKIMRAYCNKLRTEAVRFTKESEDKLEKQRKWYESCIKEKDDKLKLIKNVVMNNKNTDVIRKMLLDICTDEEPVSETSTIQSSVIVAKDSKDPLTAKIISTNDTTIDIPLESDIEVTKTDNSNNVEQSGPRKRDIPIVNTRYRSLSAPKWINHRSTGLVPVGTILQPRILHKPVTKLVNPKSFMDKSARYCLYAQEQDTDGQLETKLYKADVLPTSGGGAQVVFNDVECLKQMSPK